MDIKRIQAFLATEAGSGILLLIFALLSIIWANSPLAIWQSHFIETFLFPINEGLMTFFFLTVGLELKRGYLTGQLRRWRQIILPAGGAVFGMLVPIGIYCLITFQDPILLRGWATPVATDIAFTIGVLSLFSTRVPLGLKLFLLSLAIFDDLGAVIIIAFAYSNSLNYLALLQAVILLGILYSLRFVSLRTYHLYFLVSILLWLALLQSGVHPTITGFLLALLLPSQQKADGLTLMDLESRLHPWVAYVIMPLFALANAGFPLQDLSLQSFSEPLVLGIMAALFFGKQIGVTFGAWLVVKAFRAKLPEKVTWLELYGVAILCGIGFTMSLFLGTLSFQNAHTYLAEVRLGVISGSLLSGFAGALVLLLAFTSKTYRRRIDC